MRISVYLGIGYYCLVDEYGEKEAEKKYSEIGRKAFCPVKVMKEILIYEKPDSVIITCGVRTEKAVGIAANELGIPVLRIADLPEFEPSGCDAYTCVMNEYAKQYFITVLGENSERIFVTGQPVFETNFIMNERTNEEIRKDLDLDTYRKMIVYLEEPGLSELRQVEDQLISMARTHLDWLFIVKQHPNQNDELRNKISDNVRFLRNYPINYLLNNCDLAITRDSTAGLEATLLEKPLINLCIDGMDFDYSRYGISHKVTKLSQLPEAIMRCMNPSDEVSLAMAEGRKHFKNRANALDNIYQVLKIAWNGKIG